LARDVSRAAGLELEDPDYKPRVRINFRWLVSKMKRRVRGFLALVPGFAVAWLVAQLVRALFGTFLPDGVSEKLGHAVNVGLSAMWAMYWWTVFTASKSARAWRETPPPLPPVYARFAEVLEQRAPFLRRLLAPLL